MKATAEHTIQGRHYRSGEPIRLTVEDGRIAHIGKLAVEEEAEAEALPWLAPGLVDLQINGCNGIDFNTLPLLPADVDRAAAYLWSQGVTSFFPTVITNGDHEIAALLRAIDSACRHNPLTARLVGGIHLEGPYISPEDGARGAHPKEHVQVPDWEQFCRWQEASGNRIRIVTLSPEWPEAPQFIARCAQHGVVVSIGHTAATPEQIREAVQAGAAMSTHLGNGSHLLLPRHSNYIWEQLASDELTAGLIADGFHLPVSVLKVMLRVKQERALLVSDAVSLSGMPPGEYETHIGGKVVLTPKGRLHSAANAQILAGSAQLLPWNVEHLVRSGLCSLPDAWEMASLRPARFIGLPSGRGLTVGAPAHAVLYRFNDGKLHMVETYVDGIACSSAHR